MNRYTLNSGLGHAGHFVSNFSVPRGEVLSLPFYAERICGSVQGTLLPKATYKARGGGETQNMALSRVVSYLLLKLGKPSETLTKRIP